MKKLHFYLLIPVLLVMALSQQPMYGQDLATDSLALVALYNDCDGVNWGEGYAGWLTDPLADWEEVTVSWVKNEAGTDSSMRVTHVEFKEMDLKNALPDELGNLTEMTGKIQLHDVDDLTGTFPAFVWNWTKVTRFQLKNSSYSDVDFTGVENMVNLTEMNLGDLTMEIEIPKVFFELPAMEKLYLHEGAYIGTVPTEATAATQLVRFYVMYNQLEGPLPFIDFDDKAATQVKLEGNYFSFADVKPYEDIRAELKSLVNAFQYSKPAESVIVPEGSAYTLSGTVTDGEVYAWFKDDADVPISTDENFEITAVSLADEGTYVCKAQSSTVANFDIRTVITLKTDAPEIQRDSLALVALYNECGGENWGEGYASWLTGPLADWEEVTVSWVKNEAGTDSAMRVTHVEFKEMDLKNALPEELGNLTEMTGKIQLHDVDDLTGTFPAFVWNWTKVTRFQLKNSSYSDVDFTGVENMVNLTEMNLGDLTMEIEIPKVFFELPAMEKLYLHEGAYIGTVPMEATAATQLVRFYVMYNQLEGPLPFIDFDDKAETQVKLEGNYFSFADVKPYEDIRADLKALVNAFQYAKPAEHLFLSEGDAVTLDGTVENAESYAWFKNGGDVPVGTEAALVIDPVSYTDEGSYVCKAQSSMVDGFDIRTVVHLKTDGGTAVDSLALVSLYNDCGGSAWGDGFPSWLTGTLDTWEDVTVSWVKTESGLDSVRRVTHVEFSNMTLTGTLPDALGDISEMSGKIQMNNQIGLTGTLPALLWKWTKVERMQVKFCGFTDIDVTGMENMVNLYEFNSQETPFEGEIPVEIFNLPLMRDVYLEDGMWTSLPSEMPIPTTTPLRRFYLNGNQFTDLPDLTGMVWADGAKIKVRNNALTFEDLEPNMWIADDPMVGAFEISPQALLTEKETITVNVGDPVSMSVSCGGSANVYTWFKDGAVVAGETGDALEIAAALVSDSGAYQCVVQSTLVAGLDIASDTFTVVVNIIDGIQEFANEFRLNGNPVEHLLSIDSDQMVVYVKISDITGKIVRNEEVHTGTIRMEVSDLSHGLYFVTLGTETGEEVLKIIKQ